MPWRGVIHEYAELIDLPKNSPVITLLEGGTPLIPLPALGRMLGKEVTLYAKFEGLNPTG